MPKDKSFRNIEIMQQVEYLPEQSMGRIKAILDTSDKVKDYAYILHDKDKKPDGTPKPPHVHIMVRFNNPYKLSTIVGIFEKLIPEQYFEGIKGRWSDALAYLTHANAKGKYQYDPAEVVSNFQWEKEAAESKAKVRDIIEKIEAGEIRQFNYTDYMTAVFYAQYKRQIEAAFKFRSDRLKSKEVNRNMDCIYIVGGSGTGKTTYAKMYAQKLGYSTFISSGSNDPLDGYAGQDCIILDDLRPSCMGLSDLLKMLDNNTASTVKSRYFNKVLECRLIIITTTLDIESFFKNVFSEEPETSVQLKRRCELMVKFPKEGANDKLEVYQYDLKADKYDFLGYQENPLPKFIMDDKERRKRALKKLSVLGAVTMPPPSPAQLKTEEAGDDEEVPF